MPSTGEVRMLRVERSEHLVAGDSLVEGVDEPLEERVSADTLVQAGRVFLRGHTGSLGSETRPMASPEPLSRESTTRSFR